MVRSQVFAITKSTSTLKSLSASRRDSFPLEFHFKKKISQSCEKRFTVKAESAPIRGSKLRLLGISLDAFQTMELFSTPQFLRDSVGHSGHRIQQAIFSFSSGHGTLFACRGNSPRA